MNIINSSNCPLFKNGLYIEKVNESSAKISMCCYQQLSQTTYNDIDFYKNDYLTDLRNNIGHVKQCDSCRSMEKQNIQSYRVATLRSYQENNINPDSDDLISLTYNCENTCNLSCLTCGPQCSSKWASIYKKFNTQLYWPIDEFKKSTHRNVLYKNLNFNKLKFVHFQGGEPLLTNDHEHVMNKIDIDGDLGNVVISYNTNATRFPSNNAIRLWKKTKLTRINFSIDAVGDQFHYIRYPGNWKQVEKNMFAIRDLNISNIWLEIGITVSIANIFYIQDIIDWRDNFFNKTSTGDPINIYITIAGGRYGGGVALSLHNGITQKFSDSAFEYANKITDNSIKVGLLSALKNATIVPNQTSYINYLNTVDNIFSTNWKQTLSKLHAVSTENE